MPNINTLLREARESKGISIKDAAKALKLRERHIQMLEDGRMAELSNEIYLKGFLKTYTSWLNIDGGEELITHVNHEKKKVVMQRNTVPIVALGFSYITDLARRPGINVFLLSTILTAVIYGFWYNNNKSVYKEVDVVAAFSQSGASKDQKYSNVLEQYQGKDLVFFPHADVELKVTDTATGEEKINNLIEGDIFFLKIDEATTLRTPAPESIEVFIDNNGQQELIGTLDKILMDL